MVENEAVTTIRGDRWKAAKILALSLALVAGSLLVWRSGDNRFTAGAGVLFFGAAALVSLFGLLRPSRLVIDESGVALHGLRTRTVAWRDVARFRLIPFRRSSVIVVDYREGVAQPARRRLKGIPGTLEYSPDTIFARLQDGLARARAANPDQAAEPVEDGAAVPEPRTAIPWLSFGLVVVLAGVFAAELQWPTAPPTGALQPAVATLAAFGGLSRTLVDEGQWYRLAAAPFLHGNLVHVLLNGLALLWAGRLLEGLVGRLWFVAIYAFGALAGGAGSLLLNPPSSVSVGASGAIVALFAATYVCSFHFAQSGRRSRLQSSAIGVLLPTLFTFRHASGGLTVDFGAHLGGALGGALIGLMILKSWAPREERPGRRWLAAAASGLAGIALAASIRPALDEYPLFQHAADLIPAEALPATDAALVEQAPDLLGRFPKDPRSQLAMALHLMAESRWFDAEQEAREGLAADPVILHRLLSPRTEASLHLVVGEALERQQRNPPALAALDKAAAVDPTDADVFYQRALLRLHQGSFAEAMPDARQVATLAPKAPDGPELEGDLLLAQGEPASAVPAYDAAAQRQTTETVLRGRGLALFYAGNGDGAEADLTKAVALDPNDRYAALWLDIVRERRSLSSTLADKPEAGQGDWPAPVARLLAGETTPEDLAGLAKTRDETCEADVYRGEWDLIRRRRDDAETSLGKAATDCGPGMIEGWMARLELKRLAQAE